MTVCRDAMLRGADVFRNVSCSGAADIILMKDDQLIRVDVKSEKFDKRYSTWCSNSIQLPENIYPVLVNNGTWKPRWNKRHVPTGWEKFWD